MAISKKQIIFAGSKAKRFKYNYEHQKNIANYNIGDLYKNTNYIILGKSKLTNALLNAQKLGITIIDKELADIWIDMYTQE